MKNRDPCMQSQYFLIFPHALYYILIPCNTSYFLTLCPLMHCHRNFLGPVGLKIHRNPIGTKFGCIVQGKSKICNRYRTRPCIHHTNDNRIISSQRSLAKNMNFSNSPIHAECRLNEHSLHYFSTENRDLIFEKGPYPFP